MNYPEYIEVGDKKYKINTDFRVALRCNKISQDESIDDLERTLAIIKLLFGSEAMRDEDNFLEIVQLAKKFLLCNQEADESNEEPDMDFEQDMDYIEASFMSDFHIDLSTEHMHWWKFNKLINGLSNSELGNCCILNKIRNLRTMDISEIKDSKERKKILDAKKRFALKKKEPKLTDKQLESIKNITEALGL